MSFTQRMEDYSVTNDQLQQGRKGEKLVIAIQLHGVKQQTKIN